ncbi:hypothetical protein [Frigoribacterium sp. PhB24]|uniref:hypothetical protein n=1 Tax=Frigoribacterium sp. PhB24 TaxID=2485204 RepID=UPI000F4626E0|nr:hypothetical protein [Frigoribacterium sp. PhB24]ROS52957.1 hypothetical protein EDF50_1434 [Frigoribacterium sp. PhB24]
MSVQSRIRSLELAVALSGTRVEQGHNPSASDVVEAAATFNSFITSNNERPKITRDQVVNVFESYGDKWDEETVSDLVTLANNGVSA